MRLPAVVRRSFGQRGLVESDENRETAAEELGFQQGSHESHGRHDGYDQDARGEKQRSRDMYELQKMKGVCCGGFFFC